MYLYKIKKKLIFINVRVFNNLLKSVVKLEKNSRWTLEINKIISYSIHFYPILCQFPTF